MINWNEEKVNTVDFSSPLFCWLVMTTTQLTLVELNKTKLISVLWLKIIYGVKVWKYIDPQRRPKTPVTVPSLSLLFLVRIKFDLQLYSTCATITYSWTNSISPSLQRKVVMVYWFRFTRDAVDGMDLIKRLIAEWLTISEEDKSDW